MQALPEHLANWRAGLALELAPRHGRTVIARRDMHGPLAVQKALYPEGDLAHVYLLHPPGGLVGGDSLAIDIATAPGARALVTTPASGKVYRSAGSVARQDVHLDVAPGSSLEWLPQDTILFDASRYAGRTRIDIAAGGRYLGREQLVLGRPAHGDDYAEGAADQLLDIRVEGCGKGRGGSRSSAEAGAGSAPQSPQRQETRRHQRHA